MHAVAIERQLAIFRDAQGAQVGLPHFATRFRGQALERRLIADRLEIAQGQLQAAQNRHLLIAIGGNDQRGTGCTRVLLRQGE